MEFQKDGDEGELTNHGVVNTDVTPLGLQAKNILNNYGPPHHHTTVSLYHQAALAAGVREVSETQARDMVVLVLLHVCPTVDG